MSVGPQSSQTYARRRGRASRRVAKTPLAVAEDVFFLPLGFEAAKPTFQRLFILASLAFYTTSTLSGPWGVGAMARYLR